mmetsp:Transcript_32445/g.58210  ORF Transcript_32445/g.58210 Transcript_32445/m.58210 type:complete len:353 (+) Transcript_32445:69-1127(+)
MPRPQRVPEDYDLQDDNLSRISEGSNEAGSVASSYFSAASGCPSSAIGRLGRPVDMDFLARAAALRTPIKLGVKPPPAREPTPPASPQSVSSSNAAALLQDPEALKRIVKAFVESGVRGRRAEALRGDGRPQQVVFRLSRQVDAFEVAPEGGRGAHSVALAEDRTTRRMMIRANLQGMPMVLARQQEKAATERLEQMIGFAASAKCRHQMLAEHFNQTLASAASGGGCGACDNCLRARAGFAAGPETEAGPLKSTRKVPPKVQPKPKKQTMPRKTNLGTPASVGTLRDQQADKLRKLRKRLSPRRPYMIFPEATLQDLLDQQPQDLDSLLKVKGIGGIKVEKYGQDILKCLS